MALPKMPNLKPATNLRFRLIKLVGNAHPTP